jgi:carboxymethylenebutenolidase
MESTTPDGTISAYLAVPPSAGDPGARWPGVVVVQDALGMSEDLKRICHNFAAEGYLALAPDLYSRGGMRKCIKSVFQQALAGTGR